MIASLYRFHQLAGVCFLVVVTSQFSGCGDDTTPAPKVYSVGGTVSGLTGGGLTLVNNETDARSVSANGSYTFTLTSQGPGEYSVVLASQPADQVCTVANARGGITNADITDVDVTCVTGGVQPLYAFTGGADGSYPDSGLTAGLDGNLYGTTSYGGTNNVGTVYRVTPAGAHTVLYSFTAGPGDGQNPASGLELAPDGNFYATTTAGGAYGGGTFFKIDQAGNLTTLYSFGAAGTGTDPQGVTLGGDGTFYGTTTAGGANGLGTIYRITATGVHTVLYSFKSGVDGQAPAAGLSPAADGYLYGVTYYGGTKGFGTVFRIAPDGTGYGTVHNFLGGSKDGQYPGTKLRQGTDGGLYGSTGSGGANGLGTLFRYDRGTGAVSIVHSFAGGPADGSFPSSRLRVGPDGLLYGVTFYGGYFGGGTFYRLEVDGTLTVLYNFAGGTEGQSPNSSLFVTDAGDFYGTTVTGGPTNNGTIYKIRPQ